VTDTNDLRSYRIDSSLVKQRLGFSPSWSLEQAVIDLKKAFDANELPDSFDNDKYFNIKAMKTMGIG